MKDGAEVVTIEGLARGDALHPLQHAFIEHDAFQCGYCTPGQICSAVGLINEGRAKTADDIPELMSGNICRCGAYPNILAAVQEVMRSGAGRAIFAEVKIDQDLGVIRVTRVVSAVAGGRVLNSKTARSQVMGGIVSGVGVALEEESVMDQNFGRFINHNLAEYHVPVNADIREIDVIFVEENDSIVNPLGAKGLGEIGIVGVAAAIANAVFHATGKRVRDLPITLDKLM